jgi:hypothetical protein
LGLSVGYCEGDVGSILGNMVGVLGPDEGALLRVGEFVITIDGVIEGLSEGEIEGELLGRGVGPSVIVCSVGRSVPTLGEGLGALVGKGKLGSWEGRGVGNSATAASTVANWVGGGVITGGADWPSEGVMLGCGLGTCVGKTKYAPANQKPGKPSVGELDGLGLGTGVG